MYKELVSIIIPTFNRKDYLESTLESIKNQIYQNWECIIVDDGGYDNTESMVYNLSIQDNRFKFFKRPLHLIKGANSCRNYGFEKSKGTYVNWFDDDDIMLPNFIQDKINSIDNIAQNMIISSGYNTDEYLKNGKKISLIQSKNTLYKNFVLDGLNVLTPSILFRKEFLNKQQLFIDTINKGQEFELFSRLFFKTHKEEYKIIQSYSFLYRGHPESSTSKAIKYREDFHESSSYIISENLVRAIELSDGELIQSSYRMLLNLYRKALIHKHNYNIKFIEEIFKRKLPKWKDFVLFCLRIIKNFHLSFFRWDKIINKLKMY
ncbi:glycosyltransferase family 2 protein [Polaribacter sp. IC073]|uniref:glycosyltransferase family 2 protein n=1 Tax=Polaribacter sp. IC073 TaxID=2508540 RepID=UPI0011BF81CD|nr:glycosyltransferase family 2 protein [Polaribacter sp. IC073]TXD49120.1 glycosyltransferase family 2 protein [Polaribacter sp. IC073]